MDNKRLSPEKNTPPLSEALLPWYVNGTLSETEMDRVSRDVQMQPALAKEINQEIQLAKQWRSDPYALDELLLNEETACRKLIEKLPKNPVGVNRRPANLLPKNRAIARYCIAAALIVGIALAGLFPRVTLDKRAAEYQTLTAPVGGVVLQLIFQPDTTEREMRTLMLDGEARLLGGPTPNGVYRVVLPVHIDGAHYAKRIKQHPAIRWAELEVQSQ
jgi:outer membrane murein-binding lipoprotein Lpp